MTKLSGIVITRNEEEMIADCIDSLDFCDEIVMVDSGSEDKTIEIAERLGARVVTHKTNDFSDMRTVGLEHATHEWVLYVDADERVTSELSQNIKRAFTNAPGQEVAGYKLRRKNFYLGNHEWPRIEKLERLFNRKHLKGWYGKLHESPRVAGTMLELDGYLLHYTHRNLSSMLEKTIEWSKTEAELRFEAGHPQMTWWRFPRVMVSAFFNSYVIGQGWKVGTVGLIESIYQAFSMFITYARLWELQEHDARTKTKKT